MNVVTISIWYRSFKFRILTTAMLVFLWQTVAENARMYGWMEFDSPKAKRRFIQVISSDYFIKGTNTIKKSSSVTN